MAYTTAELEASLNGFTEKINELDAGKFILNALFGGDANALNESRFNKSFLENIKKTLEDSAKRAGAEVEKVSKEKLKQMVDPFGLSDPKTAKEMKDKVAAYKNKVNQFLDLTLPEEQKNKNDALKAVLESSSRYTAEQLELMRNASIDQPKDPKTNRYIQRTPEQNQGLDLLKDFQENLRSRSVGFEQKDFESGQTTVGSFSRNAKRDLLEVLQLDKMFEKLSGDVADKMDKKDKDKKGSGSGIADFLTGILGGGLATALMGIVGLASAFTTNGPAKGIFELLGKMGARAGLTFFAKQIFKNISKTALKRIPLIGTLFSYGFAAQRFSNGDIIGGILDIASGTINLLDLVAPGLGTVLAIGVDTIQAVLDYQAGSGTSGEMQSKKSDILKDWGKRLADNLEKVPFIGNLITFGKGFVSLFENGITSENLEQLSTLPILGIFPAILKSIWEASSLKSGEMPTFNWTKFSDGFSKTIKKAILSWIPDIPGLRRYIANTMGVDLEGNATDLNNSTSTPAMAGKMKDAYKQPLDEKNINEIAENFKKELEGKIEKYNENVFNFGDQSKSSDFSETKQYELKKQADDAKKMLEDSENLKKQAMKQEVAKKQQNHEKEYKEATSWVNQSPVMRDFFNGLKWFSFLKPDDAVLQDPLQSKKYKQTEDDELRARSQSAILNKSTPVNDFMTSGKVKITNTSGQSVTTSPDDMTYAAKDGGLIDKKLSALHKVFSEVNKNISILVDLNSRENNNNNSVVNISGGQQSKNYSGYSSTLAYKHHHMLHNDNRVAR
jgi:hypothetical protein